MLIRWWHDINLTSLNGTTHAEYTFQKKNQVVTLGLKLSSVKIDGDRIQISSFRGSLLSCNHRMIWSQPSNKNCAAIHLLFLVPLIDSSLLLREADKPALDDAI